MTSEVPSSLHDSDSINTIDVMILLLLFIPTGSILLLNTNTDSNLLVSATTTKMLVTYSCGKDY